MELGILEIFDNSVLEPAKFTKFLLSNEIYSEIRAF